jgi:hypothetical protein
MDSTPETTLVIILGASDFPRAPQFTPARAFLNSAIQVKSYFLDREGFNLPPENLLDLFDAPDPQPDLNEKIAKFFDSRLNEMKDQNPPARDVVVYYVGHGGFSSGENEYFLAIRDTRESSPFFSSYPVKVLAHTLREHAAFLRRYLILDSCFAASAYTAFMSPPLQVASQKTLEEFPQRGTALLCASGPRNPAIILPTMHYTMFSDALVHVLRYGSSDEPEKLSLASLGQLTRAEIRERNLSEAVRPEVHSPDMREGDVAILPFFPNLAFREPPGVQGTRLFVKTVPQDAKVKILDLMDKFEQGMVLEPGNYQLEVSADGYEAKRHWVELVAGKESHVTIGIERSNRDRTKDPVDLKVVVLSGLLVFLITTGLLARSFNNLVLLITIPLGLIVSLAVYNLNKIRQVIRTLFSKVDPFK